MFKKLFQLRKIALSVIVLAIACTPKKVDEDTSNQPMNKVFDILVDVLHEPHKKEDQKNSKFLKIFKGADKNEKEVKGKTGKFSYTVAAVTAGNCNASISAKYEKYESEKKPGLIVAGELSFLDRDATPSTSTAASAKAGGVACDAIAFKAKDQIEADKNIITFSGLYKAKLEFVITDNTNLKGIDDTNYNEKLFDKDQNTGFKVIYHYNNGKKDDQMELSPVSHSELFKQLLTIKTS